MPSAKNSQRTAMLAALVFVLFGTYVVYALFLTGLADRLPMVQQIFAKGGEESEHDDEGDGNDNDEDHSGSGSGKSDDNNDHKTSEAAKKQAERQREAAKQAAERARKSTQRSGSATTELNMETGDDHEDDAAELEDHSGSDDTRDDTTDDHTKTVTELNEKIAEAEAKILRKQAEGVDVTAALAALALAKQKAGAVDALFVSNQSDQAKDLAQSTERLAHEVRGKYLHVAERSSKTVVKIERRIAQVKKKLSALETAGGDASAFQAQLNAVESEWGTLKTQSGASSDPTAVAALDALERKVKTLKNAVESALLALGGGDDEFEAEHAAEVEDASGDIDDLADLAENDDDDHTFDRLKHLADDHREDARQVPILVSQLESRSGLTRQLLGDDHQSLSDLEEVVAKNESRISQMESVAQTVQDETVSKELSDRIKDLKDENVRLKNFLASFPTTNGVFGWLFNWF